MADDWQDITFGILGGYETQVNPSQILQDHAKTVHMAQAQNVIAPYQRTDLMTAPGFTKVRSSAIDAAGIVTGGVHMGDIADEVILGVSIVGTSHNYYRDNANPPGAITGGTNPTIGQNNLVSFSLFTDGTNPGAIACTRLRDTPQFFVANTTRSDFNISSTVLPKYTVVFGQRLLMGSPSVGGTVYDDRWYWSDIRNGKTITDITTQFYSVETDQKDLLRGLLVYGDICVIGKMNNVFLAAVTPAAAQPFQQRELPAGKYRGPISHQSMIHADGLAWWMGQTNIHHMDANGLVTDVGDPLKATLALLTDAQREFCCAGYDASNNLVYFNTAYNGDTVNKTSFAINTKTKQIYLRTISRNAMWSRLVSNDNRLIGGGYTGFFYNENTGTLGDLDNAASVIDADVFTPRHHGGSPTVVKLFIGLLVEFDQQATEAVTVQFRMDDASAWVSFAESPYSVQGTAGDIDVKFYRQMKVGTHCQYRFRDTNSGDIMRVSRYTVRWQPLYHKLVG